MIKNITKLIFRNTTQIISQSFGSHGPIPQHLPKVQSKTICLNVKNSYGQWQQVRAFPGESFLQALDRMKVKGFPEEKCDGHDFTYRPHERPHDPFSDGPECGNCRISLRSNWFNKIDEQTDGMTSDERFLLMSFKDDRQNLRLACCIPVQAWMDGIQLQIVPPMELGGLSEMS